LPKGTDLPAQLANFPENGILRKGRAGYFLEVQGQDERPIIIKKEDLKIFSETYIDLGPPNNNNPRKSGGKPNTNNQNRN